jgi:3-hydroxymyristoyl/3-hydroxydecanoyl-(acyl carrier protein) dehydratase
VLADMKKKAAASPGNVLNVKAKILSQRWRNLRRVNNNTHG